MRPSDAELEVLKILWVRAPLSARELHDSLASQTGWAVSTTRTIVERMRGKGLLTRHSVHGVAVYAPAQSKVAVLGDSLRHVFRTILEVPGKLPASAFSGSAILSNEEVAQLEKIINAADKSP